ncbi:MAG: glycosyltransferase [Patescibacteria group bacterium]
MKIAMVTNWTPQQPVAEYSFHLAEALGQYVELTIIADISTNHISESSNKYEVMPVWQFDSHLTPLSIIQAVKGKGFDCIWFNITLGAFGHTTGNLAGLVTPLLLKLMGYPVVITLHNLVEGMDLNKVKFAGGKLTLYGAQLATKLLTVADLIFVLLPQYQSVLSIKYGAKNVKIVPHGLLGQPKIDLSMALPKTLLSFGIYGTHKKLETTLEAMRQVWQCDPEIKLVVVGGNNAHSPNYLENLQRGCDLPNVEFRGYVSEDDVEPTFHQASAVILTNSTTGGESGAMIQACMYGKPVLTTNLPLFRQKQDEGFILDCFDVEDPDSIAESILRLFGKSQEELGEIGLHNHGLVAANGMDKVVNTCLSQIEELLAWKESVLST